ncbi:MAG: PDZ domain-containing protein [Planctomycetota bacterium]|nr:MAG: PDZ domain-containing protein [Planctomycetota bacterium]
MKLRLSPLFLSAVFAIGQTTAVFAQTPPEAPLATALAELGPEVERYNEHIIYLASPFLDGRLPGTAGMEMAKDYCQFWLQDAGLEPAFSDSEGVPSWRQPFPLGSQLEIGSAELASLQGTRLKLGEDFQALGLGTAGQAAGEAVFLGYAIAKGPDGYQSFSGTADLKGKIAVIFRFEPMDEQGQSRWSNGRGWSRQSGFSAKVRAAAKFNPAAILIVNPPAASDPRNSKLMGAGSGGSQSCEVPVLHLRTEAAARLFPNHDLMALRQHADQGKAPVNLGVRLQVKVDMDRKPLIAENVGGLLPGRGDMAQKLLVIGAHLDHLGMGDFGSRSGPGTLHPGADDNASGSSAVLMLAERLNAAYEKLPDGAQARSILFLLFSGEESGLNGSRYYVNHPIRSMEDHSLMINFDMIGRIVNRRLSVSGTGTGVGLDAILEAAKSDSELEVIIPEKLSGASDHTPFYRKQMPVLFGAIADFHGDYHTPQDVAAKINRVDAVRTVDLFEDIALAAATREQAWEFVPPKQEGNRNQTSLGSIRVRFGIAPGNYNDDEPGIVVASLTPGASAVQAGIQAGDRLVRWDGQKILNVQEWMGMLAKHKPGDVVKVGIVRDGSELTLPVTLQARNSGGPR